MSQVPKVRHSSGVSGTKSLIFGVLLSVRLPKADGAQLGERSNRMTEAALDCFNPGDERCRHRAHARNQDSEFACCGRNFDVRLL